MERIQFNFDDARMARSLLETPPPEGVKLEGPYTLVQASATAGGVFTQMIVEFVPQFSAALLAGWILLALERKGANHVRINRKDVQLTKDAIIQLISDEVSKRATHAKIAKRKRKGTG